MRIPKSWLNGPIRVQLPREAGAYGQSYTPAQQIDRAMTQEGRKMVRNAAGEMVPSSAQVLIDPEHRLPMNTLVTIWPGQPHEQTAKLVAVVRAVASGQMSHQVLYLE